MKNKTDIDALEKAFKNADALLRDNAYFLTANLLYDFIRQYKQEIHIAVEDVEPLMNKDDWGLQDVLLMGRLFNTAMEEHNDKTE